MMEVVVKILCSSRPFMKDWVKRSLKESDKQESLKFDL